MQQPTVFTIGHSTHSLEEFARLLQLHGITALVDVRSAPYSKYNPQFNKVVLQRKLRAERTAYVFLGHDLGARTDDRSCYVNGRVQYDRLARTAFFQHGIQRIIDGAAEHRIAVMCAEKEPLDCHRTLLVAQALIARGVEILHILDDGRIEHHEATLDRLLRMTGLLGEDLFKTREERLAEALALQEAKIAYVDSRLIAEDQGGRP